MKPQRVGEGLPVSWGKLAPMAEATEGPARSFPGNPRVAKKRSPIVRRLSLVVINCLRNHHARVLYPSVLKSMTWLPERGNHCGVARSEKPARR